MPTTSEIDPKSERVNSNVVDRLVLAPRLLRDGKKIRKYLAAFPTGSYKIATVRGVGKFYLDDVNDVIKNVLRGGSVWEPRIYDLMRRYVKPGTIAIDAGARIGTHTITMARLVGTTGRVYAFEPQKKIFRELVHNILLNGLDNVFPLRFALGSKSSIIEMIPVNTRPKMINQGGVGPGKGGDKAELRTIDSFGFSNVSFIKIDVEGYEDPVLDGAMNTIKRHHPVIVVEIMGGRSYEKASASFRKRIDHTIGKLRAFGYTVRRAAPDDYLAFHPKSAKSDRPGRLKKGNRCAGPGKETCADLRFVDRPRLFLLGEKRCLRVQIINRGTATFVAVGKNAVHLHARWKSADGKKAIRDDRGTPLPYYMKPGDSATVDAMVETPSKPGEYLLEFRLAQKRSDRVSQQGSGKVVVRVRVR